VTVELTPSQDAALHQLAAIPGVVGGMVFDRAGAVVAAEFPPVFEPGCLAPLAAQLAGDAYFAEWMTGEQAMLDLRFGDGHVVVRPVDDRWLLVLCTPQTNRPLLAMSLTQVVRRLRPGPGAARASPPARPAAPPPRPSVRERPQAIAAAELGGHAAQALEILNAAGDRPRDLAKAVDDVEKLTRLFISKKQAEELGRLMRDALKAAP